MYDLLKNKMPDSATVFMDNIEYISEFVSNTMQSAYEELEEQEVKEDNSNKKIYIMDTCALINNPDIFLYFAGDEYVRVPTKVIDELGKIKDKRNAKYNPEDSHKARIIAREINEVHMKQFNSLNRIRFLIENSDIDLLPPDLDPNVPDNQILSVALKYKGWDAYIVSDDGIFSLTANSQNIKVIKGSKFKEEHKGSFKSLEQRKKVYLLYKAKEKIKENAAIIEAKDEVGAEIEENLPIDVLPIKDLKLYVLDLMTKLLAFCKLITLRQLVTLEN